MMTSETKTALQRLHQCDNNEFASGWRELIHDGSQCVHDVIIAAELALAEHPSDDDDPLTPEWKSAVGFKRSIHNGYDITRIATDERELYHDDENVWCYSGDLDYTVIPTPATRGELRRLCKALKIKLNETTS